VADRKKMLWNSNGKLETNNRMWYVCVMNGMI
jgi:hypothetical protein